MNWEQILDKYGWPSLFLALVLAAVWIVGRPVVKRLLDMIDIQLTESRAVRTRETEEFLTELKAQREHSAEDRRVFAEALRLIDGQRGKR